MTDYPGPVVAPASRPDAALQGVFISWFKTLGTLAQLADDFVHNGSRLQELILLNFVKSTGLIGIHDDAAHELRRWIFGCWTASCRSRSRQPLIADNLSPQRFPLSPSMTLGGYIFDNGPPFQRDGLSMELFHASAFYPSLWRCTHQSAAFNSGVANQNQLWVDFEVSFQGALATLQDPLPTFRQFPGSSIGNDPVVSAPRARDLFFGVTSSLRNTNPTVFQIARESIELPTLDLDSGPVFGDRACVAAGRAAELFFGYAVAEENGHEVTAGNGPDSRPDSADRLRHPA